jgi:predicted acetyltransferase
MLKLVLPDKKYKDSYISMVKEFQEEDNPNAQGFMKMDVKKLEKDFESHIEKLANMRNGINLREGYVPYTKFWLLDTDRDILVGRASIRHKLNENLLNYGGNIGYSIRKSERRKGFGTQVLSLALAKAKDMGIERALITCDHDNEGSKKIIEKNGGVFEDMRIFDNGIKKLRYWIEL